MSIATFPDVVFPDSVEALMDFDDTALFQDSVTYNGTVTKNGTTVKEGPVNFLADVTATSAGSTYLFDDTTAGTGSTVFRNLKNHAQNAVNGDRVNLELGQSDTDHASLQYEKAASGSSMRAIPDPTNDPDLCFYMDYTGGIEVRSTGGTKTFGVEGDGSISMTNAVGGTGDDTEPSIASGMSWTVTLTQTGGTAVTDKAIMSTSRRRIGNIVSCDVYFRFKAGSVGAGSLLQFTINLPVASSLAAFSDVIGVIQPNLLSAGHDSGIMTSCRANTGGNNARISMYYTNAAPNNSLIAFGTRFLYIVK